MRGEPAVEVTRLMRLLRAGFVYTETVENSVWLEHAHRPNGRVIFYDDGFAVSIEYDKFASMEPDDPAIFDAFIASIQPASPKDRFFVWADDLITWTVLIAMFGVLALIGSCVQRWWQF